MAIDGVLWWPLDDEVTWHMLFWIQAYFHQMFQLQNYVANQPPSEVNSSVSKLNQHFVHRILSKNGFAVNV